LKHLRLMMMLVRHQSTLADRSPINPAGITVRTQRIR